MMELIKKLIHKIKCFLGTCCNDKGCECHTHNEK